MGDGRPLSAALVGTWELLSRVDHAANGERRIEPTLGEHPIALLIYDRAGRFAAQFMRRDAEQVDDTDETAVLQNNSRAQGGYDAYFGTYTIDDVGSTVTQTLVGALSRENVGQTLTRAMTVTGDDLTIRIDMRTADGEAVQRTLIWRRVG
ncbi:MAG TPA: lipocalin-like domain-containing protein [Ilumatobacteraceae bacterium]